MTYTPRKGTTRKKTKRKSRGDYADQKFRNLIRARDLTCQMASEECWGPLEAAHFHGRGKKAVRWNLDNAALLCKLHHGRFDTDDAMKWAWVVKRIGPERLHALSDLVREPWHKDYDRVHAELDAARLREAG